MNLIYNTLETRGVDLCVLTETHWTFAKNRTEIHDPHWKLLRLDFLDTTGSDRPLHTLQRGGISLLVNTGITTEIECIRQHDGPLTVGQWRITSPSWLHNLIITASGVYRSPSGKNSAGVKTLNLDKQMKVIQDYMTPPPLHKNKKHNAHFMAGDFNAKTACTESIRPETQRF
jgi:hypothetical protein